MQQDLNEGESFLNAVIKRMKGQYDEPTNTNPEN